MLTNQSCLESFGLIEELDEQATETISGGYGFFEIENKTVCNIPYAIDGRTGTLAPASANIWTTYSGDELNIEFDTDVRIDYIKFKKYNLADGGVYEFQNNLNTDNPYDIDLYSVEPIPLF
ncbi:hypothetical protein [Nostoc sp.]|uniref:hypothetical protein n=1 Tax=Nostoc sp. TaxID=1180 RepID=UPI002FF8B861